MIPSTSPSATASALAGIQRNLDNLNRASTRVTDPEKNADASDIVEIIQSKAAIEVGVAVLKKINEVPRLVDIIV